MNISNNKRITECFVIVDKYMHQIIIDIWCKAPFSIIYTLDAGIARWNPSCRRIEINYQITDKIKLIKIIIFELLNAREDTYYMKLRDLVINNKITIDNYVGSIEYKEYINLKIANNIYDTISKNELTIPKNIIHSWHIHYDNQIKGGHCDSIIAFYKKYHPFALFTGKFDIKNH